MIVLIISGSLGSCVGNKSNRIHTLRYHRSWIPVPFIFTTCIVVGLDVIESYLPPSLAILYQRVLTLGNLRVCIPWVGSLVAFSHGPARSTLSSILVV